MSVTLQEYVKATLISAVLVVETTSVTEAVTVKISNPKPSVVETVTVSENISTAGQLYVEIEATCKLWSRLESTSDVTAPQVGTGGAEVGSPTYASAKFNNGILSDVDNEGCTFPTSSNSINLDKGTIEFWAKLNFESTDSYIHNFFDFYSSGVGGIQFSFSDTYDDFVAKAIVGGAIITSAITAGITWSSGDLIHFAVAWDRTGNDIGNSKTLAIYINELEAASSTTTWNSDTINSNIYIGISKDGSSHSDAVIDNLKTYDYVKTDFSDRESEGAGGAGETVLVIDYPILSLGELSRQISVYDTVSLAEVLDIIIGAERSFSVYDSATIAEYINITLSNSKISVYDTVSVAEDITASLIALGISVNDATTLAEAVTMFGAAWAISVYDSTTVSESISRMLALFPSTYDSLTVSERNWLELWIERIKETDTWTERTKETDTWTKRAHKEAN